MFLEFGRYKRLRHKATNQGSNTLNMKGVEFCNNCGRSGHSFSHCKSPITSYGLIVYRRQSCDDEPELLMIRRKDSLGFVEFVRGKYPVTNREYILNIINEMTVAERELLRTKSFDQIWNELWGGTAGFQYRGEEKTSREKYDALKNGIVCGKDSFTLDDLLNHASSEWHETEWGFPKGRRNYQEKDMACGLREFEEETGYPKTKVSIIQNILPYDEIFAGSNYKCYKHRYYVGYMDYDDTTTHHDFQKHEVSKCEWKKLSDCVACVRPYNEERIAIVRSIASLVGDHVPYTED